MKLTWCPILALVPHKNNCLGVSYALCLHQAILTSRPFIAVVVVLLVFRVDISLQSKMEEDMNLELLREAALKSMAAKKKAHPGISVSQGASNYRQDVNGTSRGVYGSGKSYPRPPFDVRYSNPSPSGHFRPFHPMNHPVDRYHNNHQQHYSPMNQTRHPFHPQGPPFLPLHHHHPPHPHAMNNNPYGHQPPLLPQPPFLPLPPQYHHPGPGPPPRGPFVPGDRHRFPRLPNRRYNQRNMGQNRSQFPPQHQSNPVTGSHPVQNVQNPTLETNSKSSEIPEEGSSQESRRLPGRFSRIERSDSESEEDDRLDEYADDEEEYHLEKTDDKETQDEDSQNSFEDETKEEEEEEAEPSTESTSKEEKEPVKEEEDLSLLDEILGNDSDAEYNVDDLDDDLLGSEDEFDLYSQDKTQSKDKSPRSQSPKNPIKDTDKVAATKQVTQSLDKCSAAKINTLNEIEKKEEVAEKKTRQPIQAPSSPAIKKIRLKAPEDEDPAERRRRKFGMTSPDNQDKKSSNEEVKAKDGKTQKMRSFVVMKK